MTLVAKGFDHSLNMNAFGSNPLSSVGENDPHEDSPDGVGK